MARIARVIVEGYPHPVTQRGNRRQRTFFREADYQAYVDLTAAGCARRGVAVPAWCLMPNQMMTRRRGDERPIIQCGKKENE